MNTATNARFDTVSTGTGAYRVVGLPIGIYDLTAKSTGFSTYVQRGIQIQTNQTAAVDISLAVGAVTENITVEASVPLIQTESTDVGMVVESKQFLDMPLTLGGGIRNPSNFIKLSPGVSPTGTWTKSISGGGGFQDQIYYDGIALSRGDLSNDAEVNPSVDAIAEFKLITNNYSAEYAHAMGGVTSFTMKSGTNDLHGTGFYFVRNEKLDARGFFPATQGAFQTERVGRHDRRPGRHSEALQRQGQDILVLFLRSVLPPRRRARRLEHAADGAHAAGRFQRNPSHHLRSCQFDRILRAALHFPNNRIPVNRFSQVSAKMLPFLPAPGTSRVS